ncbi:protein-disulfide reductase DsbD family protein [Inquilinus sp. OTU3971]|uniref:protein-disulfide reductase DsbD family protein n=1 Tax=Inquilinus sp. OTU3971 TaxID=3043855 RepID=UPI00313BFB9E
MIGRLAVLTAAVLGLAALAAPSAARAAETPWQTTKGASARLVTAVDGTGTLAEIPAGLHIRLDPHWKTYWRSPGDAGLPPALDWTGSANLGTAALAYPAPHRFQLFGLETYGYETEVVFPLTLPVAQPGQPQHLALAATVLVCSDICIPANFSFALDLPAGAATPDPDAANLIDRYANTVPGDGSAAGLAIGPVAAITAGPNGGLRIEATARESFEAPDIFVEGAPGDAFAAPRIATSEGGRRLVAEIDRVQAAADPPVALPGSPVVLTLVDGPRSVEAEATVGPAVAAAPDAAAWLSILGVALLGGLILNLMPCVLPVLSLKLLSIVGVGGRTPRWQRLGLLATAGGILASFLVLAAGAVGLKAAGASVGWGLQFQEPVFLAAMAVIVTLFGCNLLGLFEVTLPGRAMDAAARASGAGRPEKHGLAGPFLTGAFATLLATPCSAPFVGTALGFALSRGPAEIGAIFAALGLGMALPYLLIAAVPGLARLLPRPGRWMVWIKAVLGLALFGTAVWLLSVLAVQVPPAAAGVVAAVLAAIVLVLWLRRRGGIAVRRLGAVVAAVLAIAAVLLPLRFDRPDAAAAQAASSIPWVRFDRAAIPGLVREGKVVFVDVTADWCLTCKVNKLLVINRDPVAAALGEAGVAPLLADWTNPDQGIADYLAAHGRYGIPFNAVYGPGAPDGILLPELLSTEAVLDALKQARGASS